MNGRSKLDEIFEELNQLRAGLERLEMEVRYLRDEVRRLCDETVLLGHFVNRRPEVLRIWGNFRFDRRRYDWGDAEHGLDLGINRRKKIVPSI